LRLPSKSPLPPSLSESLSLSKIFAGLAGLALAPPLPAALRFRCAELPFSVVEEELEGYGELDFTRLMAGEDRRDAPAELEVVRFGLEASGLGFGFGWRAIVSTRIWRSGALMPDLPRALKMPISALRVVVSWNNYISRGTELSDTR
jgi:hypothetical protein